MSCDVIASLAFLWLAAAAPVDAASSAQPPASVVAQEPLFAEIVSRAAALRTEVDSFRSGAALADGFRNRVETLAELDMQAHRTLRERGVDGDLTCILRGIAEDLPLKLAALESAQAPQDRDAALRDLHYLLNDNVEVITTPPPAPAAE